MLTDDAEAKPLPEGYAIVYEEDYTVIRTQKNLNNIGELSHFIFYLC